MASNLVSGANCCCVLHHLSSLTRWSGSRATVTGVLLATGARARAVRRTRSILVVFLWFSRVSGRSGRTGEGASQPCLTFRLIFLFCVDEFWPTGESFGMARGPRFGAQGFDSGPRGGAFEGILDPQQIIENMYLYWCPNGAYNGRASPPRAHATVRVLRSCC